MNAIGKQVSVKVTLEIEFIAKDINAARSATNRMVGDVRRTVEHGNLGSGMSGVVPGTVVVHKTYEQIT